MYDAEISSAWRHKAVSFGLPYVHRQISVFIHIPDEWPVREDAYRQNLIRTDNGVQLEVDDFQIEVRATMPQWVRDLVEQESAPRHTTDMGAVKAELQKRLRKARIKRLDATSAGQTSLNAGGIGVGTQGGRGNPSVSPVIDPDGPVPPKTNSGSAKKAPGKKMTKSRRNISSAPDIEWLDDPDRVASESLEERIGKYDYPTNKLYLNALHFLVSEKIRRLENHYGQQMDLEAVRGEIIDQVRVDMALHVGTSVVFALGKEGLLTWATEHWQKAVSPEALTISADNSDFLMRDIRSSLSQRSSFKAAKIA